MEKHNVLLKGVIRVSRVITTDRDPSLGADREALEEEFTRQLKKLGESMATEQTMVKVSRYEVGAEEIPCC